MTDLFEYVPYFLLLAAFGIVFYLIFKKNQDARQNWAIFYSLLFSFSSMQLANYLIEQWGFWSFTNSPNSFFTIPPNVFFIWLIFWAIIPLLKMRIWTSLILFFVLMWVDLLSMNHFQDMFNFQLSKKWIFGDLIFILLVCLPGYIWAYAYYFDRWLRLRGFMQVYTMILLFYFSIPILLHEFKLVKSLDFDFEHLQYQLLLIMAFPGLVGVQNLVSIGKGTPFPYDKTKHLVRCGVYAYCKNPIQWSFTITFIPLAFFHNTYYLLIGSILSVLYSLTVSDFQEYKDMEDRFGKSWIDYKKTVPKWYFTYQPRDHPHGTIYFDFNCSICTQLKNWLLNRAPLNLKVEKASNYNHKLSNVTYVDYLGNEFESLQALSKALNHTNLFYASLGWFINLPVIRQILQIIISSLDLRDHSCIRE